MSQNVDDETPMDGVIPATDPTGLHGELSGIIFGLSQHSFKNGDTCYLVTTQSWSSFSHQIRTTVDGNDLAAGFPKIVCASIGSEEQNSFVLNDHLLKPLPEQVFLRLRELVGVEMEEQCIPWEVAQEDGKMKLVPWRSPMTREELEDLIKEAEEHPMILGEKWYVVPKQWWAQVHTAFKSGYPEDILPINCGKISTETLEGYFLKPDLKETSDYVYLPQKVFQRFREFRGLQNERRDFIEREVVKGKEHLILQTYQRVVSVFLARDVNKTFSFPLTGDETMADIRDKILGGLDLANVPMDKLRFYIASSGSSDTWELIDPTQDNVDAYFDTAQKVCIDINDPDGWFIKASKSKSSLFGPKSQAAWWHMVYRAVCMLTNWRWLLSAATTLLFRLHSNPYRSYSALPSKESSALHVPGVCGLHNLGNTCFMASAVQCLSNVPPLTEYFLSGKFKEDLNRTNPLGTRGELASAYAEVIHQLWSGEHSALHPRRLKSTIGQFAPRFSGYAQQDSQELLAYVLDGLHEDLNRIKKKPYMEEDENYDRLEEHKKAEQSWEAYKARNDSIIVDKFHGQLKSKLVCPVCAKVSIKFDPFCFLSVPLPPKDRLPKLSLTVMYNTSPKRKWAKFTVTLSSSTSAMDLVKYIKTELGQQNENFHLVLFSVGINHDDVRILDPTDPVISDNGRHELFAAQVDSDASKHRVAIVKNQNATGRPLSLPMVFTIGDEGISQSFIQGKVLRFVSEVYHGRAMAASEELPCKIMLSDGKDIESFPEGLDTLDWSASKPITLIFQWKEGPVFNGYRGTDLIERECTLNSKKDIHLMDCIDIFTREEQLGEDDSWYCPNCKKHERATKKLDLWNLPEILIIHLKRFHYSRWNRDKIDTPVVIPVRGFELNDKLANEKHDHVKYDLIAMSHHAGGLGGGHYTAAALNKDTGKWYDYNDSSAFEGSPPSDPLTSRMPYLLVYQRRSVIPDGAHADANFEMETD